VGDRTGYLIMELVVAVKALRLRTVNREARQPNSLAFPPPIMVHWAAMAHRCRAIFRSLYKYIGKKNALSRHGSDNFLNFLNAFMQ
jgi:hypothetical protein